MPIAGTVAIIGTGVTRFGENFDDSYEDLALEAVVAACRDAGVATAELEAAWVGSAAVRGDAPSTKVADAVHLFPRPVTHVSNFCATGMDAVRTAAMAVAAGEHEVVLAVGVEKMRDVPPRGSLVASHALDTHPLLCKGRTAPGQFALRATRYLERWGYGREVLAKVAVKNHRNGALNPKAHFRQEITEERALRAPIVAWPLGRLDCCPTTDGAAAVVLTSRDRAERMRADYVLIEGVGLSVTGGRFSIQFREDIDYLGFDATREAARTAYAQAGIKDPASELDVVECHDCFTITEVLNYEDLGLCPEGEGGRFVADGTTALGGVLPVNPSGGLQSCGHPIGATGVRMVTEVADQIRGRAGRRQVRGARRGLAHTLGGPGIVSCVMVVGR